MKLACDRGQKIVIIKLLYNAKHERFTHLVQIPMIVRLKHLIWIDLIVVIFTTLSANGIVEASQHSNNDSVINSLTNIRQIQVNDNKTPPSF